MMALIANRQPVDGRKGSGLGFLSRNPMLVAAILLLIVFAATAPVFGTPGNAVNIMRQLASVLVLGLAMAIVVLVGGIDLSVGSVVLASASIAGIALAEGLHPALAMLAGIGIGAAIGAINAVMIEGLRLSPVIVTLGEKGALLHTKDRSEHVGAVNAGPVVETTGAGDAFNGGLAAALAKGVEPLEAMRFACAVAGISVTRPGTAPSMPTLEEVEALLAKA